MRRSVFALQVNPELPAQDAPEIFAGSAYAKWSAGLVEDRIQNKVRLIDRIGSFALRTEITVFTGVHGIYLDARDHESPIFSKDKHIEAAYTFDHELGHLIVKGGSDDDYHSNVETAIKNESAADSFAVLRAFQRHGPETARECARFLVASRATFLVTRADDGHMTSEVVEKIIEDSYKFDFTKLSPKQTLALASFYAKNERSPGDQVARLRELAAGAVTSGRADLLQTTVLGEGDKFSFTLGNKIFQPLAMSVRDAHANTFSIYKKEEQIRSAFMGARQSMTAPSDEGTSAAERQRKIMQQFLEEKRSILTPLRAAGNLVRKIADTFSPSAGDQATAGRKQRNHTTTPSP